jgi:hypothetical protein
LVYKRVKKWLLYYLTPLTNDIWVFVNIIFLQLNELEDDQKDSIELEDECSKKAIITTIKGSIDSKQEEEASLEDKLFEYIRGHEGLYCRILRYEVSSKYIEP